MPGAGPRALARRLRCFGLTARRLCLQHAPHDFADDRRFQQIADADHVAAARWVRLCFLRRSLPARARDGLRRRCTGRPSVANRYHSTPPMMAAAANAAPIEDLGCARANSYAEYAPR